MTVILNKESMQTSKIVSQKYSQTTIDSDVIVPDVNPDIKKVMDVSGYISISEKSIRNGKVFIQGTVNMIVLYAPDGDTLNKVKSLNSSQPFSHSIDIGAQSDGANLSMDIEAESFNYSLINSRKVNLRCTIGMNLKLTEASVFEVAVCSDSTQDICTKTQKIRICDMPITAESRVVICDQAALPSGNPSIGEILKATVYPESSELILMENSALARGQVKLCFLYTSFDDGSIQTTEHTIPFEETLEILGVEEDMEAEIEYLLSDMYCEIRDDSDGEPRIFGFEIGLSANLRGMRIHEPEIICDAYSLNGKTNLTSKPIKLEQLVSNTTSQLTHKTSIKLPDALPEIARICDVSTNTSVDRIDVNNGEITVFGHVQSNILYTTKDEDIPLCTFSDTSDFSHTLPAAYPDNDIICDAKIFTEHTSYTMNSPGSLDLRVVLGLCVRSFTEGTICPITDIDIEDVDDVQRKPSLHIYFVQSGDTLWGIAKRYQTTVENLMECNNLTDDLLDIGQQIIIC